MKVTIVSLGAALLLEVVGAKCSFRLCLLCMRVTHSCMGSHSLLLASESDVSLSELCDLCGIYCKCLAVIR